MSMRIIWNRAVPGIRRLCTRATTTEGGFPTGDANTAQAKANAGILGFIDPHGGAGAAKTGRAWRTNELRLKSFDDLHRLWYVLLRERNVLLTEKEWCRSNGRHWLRGESNLYKVKRSMARLKGVVGERNRVYKAQQALVKAREEGGRPGDTTKGLAVGVSRTSKRPGVMRRTR